jgi:hypothetical protein
MSSEQSITTTISWNKRLEQYFAETGEKAHCLAWIHRKAEEMYSSRSVWIDLPVIILGTLNGAVVLALTPSLVVVPLPPLA